MTLMTHPDRYSDDHETHGSMIDQPLNWRLLTALSLNVVAWLMILKMAA